VESIIIFIFIVFKLTAKRPGYML